MYAVWVPSLPADNEDSVPTATTKLPDERVSHYWDAKGELKQAYQRALKMDEPARNVYYVYERGAEWRGDLPPAPTDYMHQLRSLPSDRMLDGSRLAEEMNKLLKRK